MKMFLRSIQTLFPYLHDLRFSLQFILTKITRVPHESDFNALKMFKPNSDQVFIDVGSNRGEAILSMIVVGKFKNEIIGFEPNEIIYKRLKNYFSRDPRVLVHNFGLGEKNQDLTLYVPFYRNWMFDGLSSFIYESAESWLKTRIWRFDEKKLSIKELPCRIRMLDDFQLAPYFIKIDVQGYEFEVLNGGINTIKCYKPILLIESISTKVINFIEQFGYEIYYLENGRFIKGRGILNTFCMTPEKHLELTSE